MLLFDFQNFMITFFSSLTILLFNNLSFISFKTHTYDYFFTMLFIMRSLLIIKIHGNLHTIICLIHYIYFKLKIGLVNQNSYKYIYLLPSWNWWTDPPLPEANKIYDVLPRDKIYFFWFFIFWFYTHPN